MIIIDNFLTEPDRIREDGLELDYTKAQPNSPGWRGFRCLYTNMVGMELNELIKNKLLPTFYQITLPEKRNWPTQKWLKTSKMLSKSS